jgi:hypothetical protein
LQFICRDAGGQTPQRLDRQAVEPHSPSQIRGGFASTLGPRWSAPCHNRCRRAYVRRFDTTRVVRLVRQPKEANRPHVVAAPMGGV